jgi:hypothetical protein
VRVLVLTCLIAVAAAASCGTFGCCAGSHFPALGPGGMGCAQFAQCTGCEKFMQAPDGYDNWAIEEQSRAPPCCSEIKKFIAKLKTEGFNSKLTPGTGCSGLTDCTKCNMLNFCAWNNGGAGECQEIRKVPIKEQIHLSKTCLVKDNYVSVQLREPKKFEGTPDVNGFTFVQKVDPTLKASMQSPIVADGPIDWPVDFDGHLPAAGCGHIDMKQYPSGIPGCKNQFEELHGEGQFGNMDHGLPTDPRYPVETHVPQYPLGAHPNLPDKVAQQGGDYNQQPMEHSPWVIPDFNRNGCLDGPCDPHFLKPVTEGPVNFGQ